MCSSLNKNSKMLAYSAGVWPEDQPRRVEDIEGVLSASMGILRQLWPVATLAVRGATCIALYSSFIKSARLRGRLLLDLVQS